MYARPLFTSLLLEVFHAAGAEAWTPKELKAARKVYVVKCAKCHQFHEPTSYPEPDWSSRMEKMTRKSKLKPRQVTLLDRYLDDYRAGRLAGRPEKELKPVAPDGKAP